MFRVKIFKNICYSYAFPNFDPERNDPKTNPTERTKKYSWSKKDINQPYLY